MTTEVRTRFAPTPTSELHTGSVRTALVNRLFATHAGGSMVLRIDDTDTERSSVEYEHGIYEGLKWLGIDWEEGPDIGGGHGPYRQSERAGIYDAEAGRLIDTGAAYYCRCTKERLAGLAEEQKAKGLPPRYDGRCRELGLTPDAPHKDAPLVVRFRVPDDARVEISDMVHGPVSFDRRALGDFIIIASDGSPSYNFATVVDDACMRITHVIRGDDHLPNTPRQALLFAALGHPEPAWCHLPLVLAPDHTPLGKRHGGSATISGLKEAGYLPEAVTNALVRLGYTPPNADGELLTIDEMARTFDPARLSKSPSVFDVNSLDAMNRKAIAGSSAARLARLMPDEIRDADEEKLKDAIEAVKADASTIAGLARLAAPFAGELTLDDDAREALSTPAARDTLKAFLTEAEKTGDWNREGFNSAVKAAGKAAGAKGRALFMPIRLAITGMECGIALADAAMLLGRETVMERVKRSLEL